ncbi:MAG: Rsd/AlgQ family anti-sigma factor [Candidatus Neomarinimicrobiota bacterium]
MQSEKETERRQSPQQLIDSIIIERKQLLAFLFQATNINTPDNEFLEEFCQILVDYIAVGHFILYDRILDNKERRKTIIELAEIIYPEIEKYTQVALDFNEKYNANQDDIDGEKLKNDISILGEALTARIELEDKLISSLTNELQQAG